MSSEIATHAGASDLGKIALLVLACASVVSAAAYYAGDNFGYWRGYSAGKKAAYERSAEIAEYGHLGCIHDPCNGAKEVAMWTRDTIQKVATHDQ